MAIEYSRRELAERLARTPEEVVSKSGRIQHWTEKGLFLLLGDKHVGRGRARSYPAAALWLAAFFDHCADRGATIGQMAYWAPPFMHFDHREQVKASILELAKKHPGIEPAINTLEAGLKPLDDALAGKAVYMMIREPRPSTSDIPILEFSNEPVVPPEWPGASIFNLTAIFDRVRGNFFGHDE